MRVETIGNATLYLADAQLCVDEITQANAVVTDPPYGVDGAQNTKTRDRRGGQKNAYSSFRDSPTYVGEVVVPVMKRLLDRGMRAVITPGNRCLTLYPLPAAFGAVFQPASVGLQAWGRADAQPILYYGKSPYGGIQLPSRRCSYTLTESPPADAEGHPCPKPLRFWTAIVESASLHGETVLDPFMGSGTTGVVCAGLGRSFIGIEIDEAYFDIACERIENAQRQERLFA